MKIMMGKSLDYLDDLIFYATSLSKALEQDEVEHLEELALSVFIRANGVLETTTDRLSNLSRLLESSDLSDATLADLAADWTPKAEQLREIQLLRTQLDQIRPDSDSRYAALKLLRFIDKLAVSPIVGPEEAVGIGASINKRVTYATNQGGNPVQRNRFLTSRIKWTVEDIPTARRHIEQAFSRLQTLLRARQAADTIHPLTGKDRSHLLNTTSYQLGESPRFGSDFRLNQNDQSEEITTRAEQYELAISAMWPPNQSRVPLSPEQMKALAAENFYLKRQIANLLIENQQLKDSLQGQD